MNVAIFGVSGFSREARDIALELGYKEIIFIDKYSTGFLDDYLVFSEDNVYKLAQAGYTFVIGIGNPSIRKEIASKYSDLEFINLVHPKATFGYEQLHEVENRVGNIICSGVRMTNNIQIGDFGIYNLNCTVGHDCIIGDFVTIGPGANISGNVKLSIGSYIGTNACILQGKSITEKLTIGQYATIGAGAVVTKNVLPYRMIKGNPAK
ncbi:NeuD/PglB/VioB family sugar acetyltransferase [Clostridiaceae bacterium M8S5]|nr:NeuD/PglB/VioB family sugar acetyltransferase [Clostridiaceae bacterium M8S5]